jgi:hypothetical protein
VPVLAVARTDPNAPAVPGDKQCRWCRAKAECPALAKMASEITATVFDFNYEDPTVTAAQRFAEVLPKLDLIEDWCKAQREAANAHMRAGHPIPGFKLVEGRRGNRAWIDAAAVESLMRETFRLKHDEMYDRTVIGPKAAEELLAKASPRRWMKLQPHITQGGGKPSVAPQSDKRPAIAVAQSGEFADLSSEEDIA